ncbi:ADP-glyceromanno-heptose 6-epimerase [Sphingomonas sp. BIUV-7]|uniref:ADP-L-glycero-D-manno-heptose-6-epimerase n=1 Tax=Sphingomonas natans TaxID=3063330 RepID=A0ABT8Y5R3_9SPHN|nr:ADP-glyceromanno-heptose 6-epimerase [Sphingomonas sp. BIUV-7]MDO6413660.1 ADP-glyceromanno-heptose 6-epimerase [Sphingomonas sp. BIUV-7]
MIVVTGAAGFIGSNIVSTLNERGRDDIAVCDWVGSGAKWRNLAKAGFVDWISPPDLLSWLERRTDVDAIIHMGAISSTTARDGDAVIATNFRLSLDLLEFCTNRETPFLYASSAAVYGDGELGFDDDASPAAVRALRPLNLYGWSKRQFDFVVADRIARGAPFPPSCVGLRFFNVFGPNEYHKDEMQSIVAKIAGPIGRGEGITLFKSHREGINDGDQRRDFIYVKDAVALALHLHDRGTTGIYNVGTGQARSFRELAIATFAAFGRSPQIDYVDMPESIRDKYQYFTQASLERVRNADFATPFFSLEESVADYVQSYLDRADPYR